MFKFILSILSLTSCTSIHLPKYKVGDCLKQEFKEEFSTTIVVYKILQIGKEDYQFIKGFSNDGINPEGRPWISENAIQYIDDHTNLIKCSGNLK